MGTSNPETKPFITDRILEVAPKRILDVGAGCGTYLGALRLRGYAGGMDAVEVWRPYIDQFRLTERYDTVYEQDIRDWMPHHFSDYDVVIFGDVLEHLSEDDALRVWSNAHTARYGVIALPIVRYPQGALNGNPYEVHVVDDWTHERVMSTFDGIVRSWCGSQSGAYWAEFLRGGDDGRA